MPPIRTTDATGWLHEFLARARARNWCVSIYCTTCGALDFRIGLLDEVRLAQGLLRRERGPDQRPLDGGYSESDARTLAHALATLERDSLDWPNLSAALRMMLHELDGSLGPIGMALIVLPLIGDSWAGRTLGAMRAHHAARVAECREQKAYESPGAAAARKAEKKRLKAEAHTARLEAKQERDRAWWASHPKP